MTRTFSLLGATAVLLFSFLRASAVTIDTQLVGNPGNANDASDGDDFTPGVQNFGSVADSYRIGTYEVTNTQYAEFLNAKAASDPLDLYSANMGSNARGGIARSGVDGSYTYAVKLNMGNKPVNYVNWYDAIRFANWLNNGQGNGDTESGAYSILGATPIPSNATSINRNAGATWFLPAENEWYKAAYYQPAGQGGPSSNYWFYPTQSNSAPAVATANGVGDINNSSSKVANRQNGADWNGQDGNVTSVGSAGTLSRSFYGTSDQGGNVWEMTETLYNGGADRGSRGAGWDTFLSTHMASSTHSVGGAELDRNNVGFRVATIVPEPGTLALGVLGAIGAYLLARKRQR